MGNIPRAMEKKLFDTPREKSVFVSREMHVVHHTTPHGTVTVGQAPGSVSVSAQWKG